MSWQWEWDAEDPAVRLASVNAQIKELREQRADIEKEIAESRSPHQVGQKLRNYITGAFCIVDAVRYAGEQEPGYTLSVRKLTRAGHPCKNVERLHNAEQWRAVPC